MWLAGRVCNQAMIKQCRTRRTHEQAPSAKHLAPTFFRENSTIEFHTHLNLTTLPSNQYLRIYRDRKASNQHLQPDKLIKDIWKNAHLKEGSRVLPRSPLTPQSKISNKESARHVANKRKPTKPAFVFLRSPMETQ